MYNDYQTLERFYRDLPIGILILNAKLMMIYTNMAYRKIMGITETDEVATNTFHQFFLAGIKKNRNKTQGTIQIKNNDLLGTKIAFDLFAQDFPFMDKKSSYKIYSLLPLELKETFTESKDKKHLIFGDLRLYLAGGFAKFKGTVIPLSKTEFALFSYLCAREDDLISKAELLKNVWQKRSQNTRTVDIYIARVRKKLKEAGCITLDIHTHHGQGYGVFINRQFS